MPDNKASNNNRIQNLPLKLIKPNPDQPRKYFDPDSMDALTRSVERYGVLSPITVRQTGDEYILISGERRYRAAFNAGLRSIPCIITDINADCAILSLLENLQREDLSFLEVAESYKELIKKKGISSHELSRKIGDNPYAIKERTKLMRLDPLARKYVRNFKLSERQAQALLRIKDNKLQVDAARHICEAKLDENESIRFITEISKSSDEPNVRINKFKDIKIFRNTLSNAVGIIRRSGIDADYSEKSYDWGEEFVIVIRN